MCEKLNFDTKQEIMYMILVQCTENEVCMQFKQV